MAGCDINLDFLFIGETHFEDAENFEKALCEKGQSRLILPYKRELTVNVLDFQVKNGHITNINTTVISVNFHETSSTNYPESIKSGINEIRTAAEKTNTIVAQNFSEVVEKVKTATNPTRVQNFISSYNNMMNNVSTALSTVDNMSLNSIMTDILGQNVLNNAHIMTSQFQIVMSKAASLSSKFLNLSSNFSFSDILNSTLGTTSFLGPFNTLVSSLIKSSKTDYQTLSNLNTKNIVVSVYNCMDDIVYPEVSVNSENYIRIEINSAVDITDGEYRVVIIGVPEPSEDHEIEITDDLVIQQP